MAKQGNQHKLSHPGVFNIPLEPPAPTVGRDQHPCLPALMPKTRGVPWVCPHLCPGWSHPSPLLLPEGLPSTVFLQPTPWKLPWTVRTLWLSTGSQVKTRTTATTNWPASSAKWEVVSVVTRKLHSSQGLPTISAYIGNYGQFSPQKGRGLWGREISEEVLGGEG